ncbi:MAG: hypothetical protein WA705_12680 [Candidatus Ozemobacteraceae bacterium]
MRTYSLFFLCCLMLAFLAPQGLFADTLVQNFEHKLGMNAPSQSWEHRIDLPDNLNQLGFSFFRRTLTLSGKMVIEAEELTSTYYYVKVRLGKTFFGSKGSIAISLEAAKDLPPCNPLAAPTELKISQKSDPMAPTFTWKGEGKYTAISLFDSTINETVWERIVPAALSASVDGCGLHINHHYKWAVKQSDICAKYSPEAQAGFRLELRVERCMPCNGLGYTRCNSCNGSGQIVSQGPNGTPVVSICSWCHGSGRQMCTFCNGTGRVERPIIITE